MQRLVDITINQDWDKVRQVFQKLNERRLAGLLEFNKIDHDEIGMTHYSIGEHGSIGVDKGTAVGRSTYGSGWVDFGGQLLYSLLSWSGQARSLFKEANLVSICWITTNAPINLHVDYKNFDDPTAPYYIESLSNKGKQCKINYIVSSEDSDAVTISYDHDDPTKSWSTRSIPGTAFLLDTDYPHEVKNSKHREIIQFLFNDGYQEVSNLVDKIGPIRFE